MQTRVRRGERVRANVADAADDDLHEYPLRTILKLEVSLPTVLR